MKSRRWLILALVAWGLGSACSQFNTNLSLQTSSSAISFLSPSTVPAGGSGFTITVNGQGFVSGALILWNETALNTTPVSNTQLTATVPAANIATPGTVQIAVQIPGSAVSGSSSTNATTTTEKSNVVNFTISAAGTAAPTITSISTPPLASTPYCQPNGFTLTVNGTNFVNGSAINWNGSPRLTSFVSSTQLSAAISPADAAFPGTVPVIVTNPSGSAPSNLLPFTLTTPPTGLPLPSITSLSQTAVTAGSPTFTLTVNGSSFAPCSVVRWDGSDKATIFVSATQLTATIPAGDIISANPGPNPRNVNVTVFTLAPGGGSSSAITFTVNP